MGRVLLVDDEKVARALYGDLLRESGHDVVAVSSIAEARQALEGEPFDAVVTDLLLPQGDGMEVLQLAKESSSSAEVIVITALDKVGPAVRAMKAGASEYLVKPVAPEALQHAVTRALSARNLLRENKSLRRYVQLLESGQRIASVIDRAHLVSTAGHAFQQLRGADAVLFFRKEGEEQFLYEGAAGLDDEIAESTRVAIASQLRASESPLQLNAPAPFQRAWAYPAIDGNLWGFAALLFRSRGSDRMSGWPRPPNSLLTDSKPTPPTGIALAESDREAEFLSRHLALGWRNVGRFAEVEDLAYIDDLTHLFNVRYLHLVLDREAKSAQQTQLPFSLLFLDLDYFKAVNDTHGHLVGSKMLVEMARVLKSCVRDNDVVVRYGGDEYVVLLRGTDSGGALKVAERIRRTVESRQFLAREGLNLQATTCIGVASFPEHAHDKLTLLDFADRAMYRGKKSARNVVYMAASDLEATPAARHSASS